MNNALSTLEQGIIAPFDGRPPVDQAQAVALGVLAGLSNELDSIDNGDRSAVVEKLADIIRVGMADVSAANEPKIEHEEEYDDEEEEKEPPTQRELLVNAVVGIANRNGYAKDISLLEACHNTAREVLGVFDGLCPGIPLMLVTAAPTKEFQATHTDSVWNEIIPLNRRSDESATAGSTLTDDYDIIRMRSAAAARVMFGSN